jgi:hypothetical protein
LVSGLGVFVFVCVCVCVRVCVFSLLLLEAEGRLVWRVYRVAGWWLYCQTDSVTMDVGDREQGYHCHLSDHEVPRP